MRSRKHHKENEYLSHLQADPNNEIKSMIIKIRKFITKLGMLLNKTERNNIRKRLNQIDKERRNRRQKRRLLDELTKEGFGGNYQMYTCRGNKEKTMYIKEYLQKVKPTLSL